MRKVEKLDSRSILYDGNYSRKSMKNDLLWNDFLKKYEEIYFCGPVDGVLLAGADGAPPGAVGFGVRPVGPFFSNN